MTDLTTIRALAQATDDQLLAVIARRASVRDLLHGVIHEGLDPALLTAEVQHARGLIEEMLGHAQQEEEACREVAMPIAVVPVELPHFLDELDAGDPREIVCSFCKESARHFADRGPILLASCEDPACMGAFERACRPSLRLVQ